LNRETYWKAKTAVSRGHITLEEADGGFLSFFVKDLKNPKTTHEVWRDGSGVWHCNALSKKKLYCGINKWGERQYREEKVHCPTFNSQRLCWHVLSCKIWLKGGDL
jgi:hypothetical protein